MSKKKFNSLGFDSLLGEEKKEDKQKQTDSKKNEIRATFLVEEDLLDKIKAIAYWDRLLIKQVINKAILKEVENYEKLNGVIKKIPRKIN